MTLMHQLLLNGILFSHPSAKYIHLHKGEVDKIELNAINSLDITFTAGLKGSQLIALPAPEGLTFTLIKDEELQDSTLIKLIVPRDDITINGIRIRKLIHTPLVFNQYLVTDVTASIFNISEHAIVFILNPAITKEEYIALINETIILKVIDGSAECKIGNLNYLILSKDTREINSVDAHPISLTDQFRNYAINESKIIPVYISELLSDLREQINPNFIAMPMKVDKKVSSSNILRYAIESREVVKRLRPNPPLVMFGVINLKLSIISGSLDDTDRITHLYNNLLLISNRTHIDTSLSIIIDGVEEHFPISIASLYPNATLGPPVELLAGGEEAKHYAFHIAAKLHYFQYLNEKIGKRIEMIKSLIKIGKFNTFTYTEIIKTIKPKNLPYERYENK